jgi:hypothetical protein
MVGNVSPQRFASFLESAASATYDEFKSFPGSQVTSSEAFEEMRKYLLDLYKGVYVVASFVQENGQVIDCFPAAEHPAAKRWGEDALRAAPASQPAPASHGSKPPSFVSPAIEAISDPAARTRDQDGLEIRSKYPPGTLPMYRTTLQQLSRFKNLAAFCGKESPGKVFSPTESTLNKRYATGEQDVACLGGASKVNVWKPFATPSFQEIYSQQRYLAGQDGTLLQTVECGWHVDYARYHDSEAHLFVYTTRQTYATGHSFWNEDGGVYVPLAGNVVRPGAPLVASQTDGTQTEYQMGFYLNNGAWFFYFQGQPVGFYPLAWFNNGPLATGATRIRFGGEVGTGMSLWPPMGSGRFAMDGFGKAAYQRAALAYPTAGGALSANLAVAGSTTGSRYTVDITNSTTTDWGTILFFGGPGGNSC